MNLRGIVAVSGKPGLFKLIGQNKTGFILEGLDEQKTKLVVHVAEDPLKAVVCGTGIALKNINNFSFLMTKNG